MCFAAILLQSQYNIKTDKNMYYHKAFYFRAAQWGILNK